MGNMMLSEQKSPFQKIYEENYMKMYHIAFGILKHRMEAENAVQEAFDSIAKNYKTCWNAHSHGFNPKPRIYYLKIDSG